MIDLKLATAFIGWTVTTFVAHYSVKRILLAAAPGGAEVRKSCICICFAFFGFAFASPGGVEVKKRNCMKPEIL